MKSGRSTEGPLNGTPRAQERLALLRAACAERLGSAAPAVVIDELLERLARLEHENEMLLGRQPDGLAAQLIASQERYQRLFDAAPEPVLLVVLEGDDAGRILDANESAAANHGYTRNELLTIPISDLETPRAARDLQSRIQRILTEGRLVFETEHRRKDGSILPLEVSVRVTWVEGRRCGLSFERDISAAKRLEAIDREQRVRLEIAADAGGVGFWDWDLRTNEVFFSEEWKRQLGCTGEEIPGSYEEWQIRLHPEDRDRAIQSVTDYLEGRTTDYSTEFRLRHKDGGYRWIFARGEMLRDPEGVAYRMLGCHLDVTPGKLSELALRSSQECLNRTLEALTEGVVVQDHAAAIVYCNAAACQTLGLTLDQMSGRTSMDPRWAAVHEDGSPFPGEEHPAAVTLRTGQPQHDVIMGVRKPDGMLSWIAITSIPLQILVDGKPGVVSSFVDITGQRAAELERQTLEFKLHQAQKLEAIGTLAGGIAHDFNNILGAITGNLELARMDALEGKPVEPSLAEISKASKRAKALVRQILAFGQQQPMDRRSISLNAVVSETTQFLRSTLSAMVSIEHSLDKEAQSVLADPHQLQQILINLCTNAWQAMEGRAGNIRIEVSREKVDERAAAEIQGIAAGDYVCMTVRDDGKGMDEATMKRIFEPFFTTKPSGQGTGLGLSVVHGIVRSHGGFITVTSSPGYGAVFRVHLPAATHVAVGLDAPQDLVRGQGQHILCLDDEEPLGRVMSAILGRLGYRVTGFTKPELALEAFRANPAKFDAVITDYEMPGMTGLAVSREILRLSPRSPIILLSGFLKDEIRRQAAALGIREVMTKPLEPETMSRVLAGLLNRRKQP